MTNFITNLNINEAKPAYNHAKIALESMLTKRLKPQQHPLTHREKVVLEENIAKNMIEAASTWESFMGLIDTLLSGEYRVSKYEKIGAHGNVFGNPILYIMIDDSEGVDKVIKIDSDSKIIEFWKHN